jgi:hypothetical protein
MYLNPARPNQFGQIFQSLNDPIMKRMILFLALCSTLSIKAQTIPTFGLALDHVNAFEKVFSLYAKDYDHILAFQYSMVYDETKMTYLGLRNGVLLGYDPSCMGHPADGSLTSAWFDVTLIGQNHPDSAILIQFVFSIVQPGGSTLCFTDHPTEYTFMKESEDEPINLNQMRLQDDCFTGIIDIGDLSGLTPVRQDAPAWLDHVLLTSSGELYFHSNYSGLLSLVLHDMTGREITRISRQQVTEGRSKVSMPVAIPAASYLLSAIPESGTPQSMMIVVY